jgi:putative ABC transport system permease protein
MHIRPILSTLRRHRTAATLIVLEIAVTCAIICNAVFIIGERLGRMNRETGIAEDELIRVQVAGIGRNANPEVLTREDLAALSAVPGVRKVAVTNQLPFGNSSWNSGVTLDPDQKLENFNAATYLGTDDLLETLGVRIIAGRDFTPAEFVEWKEIDIADSKAKITAVILSKAAAERLFPGQNALGKPVYIWGEKEDEAHRVVGIVDRLARPNEQGGPSAVELSVILPVRLPYTMGGNYIMRVDPERRWSETAPTASCSRSSSSPRSAPSTSGRTRPWRGCWSRSASGSLSSPRWGSSAWPASGCSSAAARSASAAPWGRPAARSCATSRPRTSSWPRWESSSAWPWRTASTCS